MYVVSESLSYICSMKQLDDALKHIDDVKKGVKIMLMLRQTWVKAFRIIPDFRISRLTFCRKSASKC